MSDNQQRLTLVVYRENHFLRIRKFYLNEEEIDRLSAEMRKLQADDQVQEWAIQQDGGIVPIGNLKDFLSEWS